MTGDRSLLKIFIKKFIGTVRFRNDNFATITGYGDYIQGNITICHVYYVECLGHNLFSVGQFCDSDLEVAFHSKTCYMRNLEGDDLLTGDRESNLYTISISDMAASSLVCLMSKANSTKAWLWHNRLSHLNFGTINDLTRLDLVDGLPKFKYGKDHLCSAYERGKSKKASHPLKLVSSDHSKLELLHMDLCGPMRVASINGKKYILVIVDDYSRYTWVYFLHSKDETPEIIKKFIAQAQLNYKAKVCKIRTDNGTEFKNATLKAHYEKLGIMQQFSTARTPQQNGVVERRNRTLVEAARTMLIFSRLPEFLWAEAVATACFTQNRSIIHTRHNKTPYELLRGRKPNVEYFHVFGSLCYPTNDRDDLGKMKPKADIGVFIGYSETSRGFRIYNRRTKKIMETINVKFDELTTMASEHDCLEPELQRFINHNSSAEEMNTPSKEDLDNLFEADEFNQEDSAHSDGNSQFVSYNPPSREEIESSTTALESSNVQNFHQVQPSTHIWTKDHPLDQVIGDPSKPVMTRQRLHTDSKVKKASNCLKQAPRAWYDKLSSFLIEHGFTKDEYVSISTHMATERLDADLQGTPTDQTTYHYIIGGLMYLTASRPDIAFATFVCARYQARPTVKHLKEVKRIFRYLRQSYNMGLCYPKDSGFELIAYSDADHAGCKDDCKSTSGGLQFLGGKLVSWSSKKQDCTAMSTVEAEYVSLSACLIIMAQQQHAADVHPDELCPPNKRYDLMDANKKLLHPYHGFIWHSSGILLKEDGSKYRLRFMLDKKELSLTLDDFRIIFHLPQANDIPIIIHSCHHHHFLDFGSFYKHTLGFTMELKTSSSFKTTGLLQLWQTLCKIFFKCLTTQLLWEGIYYSLHHPTSSIPYPRFTKIIVSHYMTIFPEISRRARDMYHNLQDDDIMKNIFNSGRHKDKVGMQIPDWMITEDMKHTEHYRMYAEVFGLDVPLTQSQSTESTQGTHKTPSAPSREEQEARENVELVNKHLASEEIEKLVEGSENVIDDSLPPRNDEPHILGTRLEPKSDKESPEVERTNDEEVEVTNVVIPVNVNEEEDEITDEVYELKRREKGKIVEESRSTPLPTPIRSPRTHTNLVSSDTKKLQELTGRYTYLFEHLKERFLSRKSFDTLADHLQEVRDQVPVYVAEGLIMERQKTKEEMEQMIAKAILQERGNIQAEISSQIQKAIDNHIPSQVDASVRSYMSGHILHVHPAQTQTLSVPEQQYQLYLSMKDNPQLQQQDIAIWLALQMKFENLQVPQTTCRPSAVRTRDQDDPHDDAHPEGENSAKR
ncbi:retrovirus-related pol polyprotein from transposon TNT 1-94 [Tanacetum coccineum]|uniref:Retrovirus-related pol polyprotein from transposon TNT 1-94 n=1 Tax=Tanacetum coccineum TaxID=301880 RepID=A0ABQ5HUZ0_9ASTR